MKNYLAQNVSSAKAEKRRSQFVLLQPIHLFIDHGRERGSFLFLQLEFLLPGGANEPLSYAGG